MNGDRAVGVTGNLIDAHAKEVGSFDVWAKRVVLACGAAHSPLVLWASGLSNPHLGKHLTLHPGFRVIAAFDEPVRGWDGALQSAYSDTFEEDHITLMSVFVPPFAVAAGVPGVGSEFTRRAKNLDKLAMFGGLIHDDGGGRVWNAPFGREPIMTYRMSPKDRALIPEIIRRLAQPFLEAGANELYLPILGSEPVNRDKFASFDLETVSPQRYECSSQHPLGTVRMGTSKRHSVVDDHGRVWGTRGLHVVDGGILPTSLGVNPQWTIMAMARRLATMMV
jgi:choline dehydrogenase-like flavoprotein